MTAESKEEWSRHLIAGVGCYFPKMWALAEANARFLRAAATKLFYSGIVREGREGETGETCHQAWMLVWKRQV